MNCRLIAQAGRADSELIQNDSVELHQSVSGAELGPTVVLRQEEPAKGKCIENINLYHFSM